MLREKQMSNEITLMKCFQDSQDLQKKKNNNILLNQTINICMSEYVVKSEHVVNIVVKKT